MGYRHFQSSHIWLFNNICIIEAMQIYLTLKFTIITIYLGIRMSRAQAVMIMCAFLFLLNFYE